MLEREKVSFSQVEIFCPRLLAECCRSEAADESLDT